MVAATVLAKTNPVNYIPVWGDHGAAYILRTA